MARGLKKREPIDVGVRRLATREVRRALKALHRHPDGPDEGVHRARIACKRIRAWIRLVEGGMPDSDANEAALRDAAKLTSRQRDAVVIRLALAHLAGADATLASPAAWADAQLLALGHGHAGPSAPDAARMREALERVAGNIETWRIDDDGEALVRRGLERGYVQAKSSFDAWRGEGTIEQLHDWRKRVKRLMFQLSILRRVGPRHARRMTRRLRRLGDVLGEHRDLDLVRHELERMPDVPQRRALLEAVEHVQAALSARARRLGERTFDGGRRRFVRRALPRQVRVRPT